ncbi:SDR family NAD(P)-dependent oxidoreductase [Thermodesulfobacteriota bacterium]
MDKLFQDKAVIVTGGGNGIGRAIALAFASEGAQVLVNDLGVTPGGGSPNGSVASSVVDEIRSKGGVAVAHSGSVADFSTAQDIIDTCTQQFNKVDILINAAGIHRPAMVYKMAEVDWDAVISVHLKGTFNCSRHACSVMREQRWGRIINFVSDAWRGVAGFGLASYSAAKAGIVGLTRSLAVELVRYGITCNAISPIADTRWFQSFEATEAVETAWQKGHGEKWLFDAMIDPAPPEHVAPMVMFLATEDGKNVNGRVFGVSRGRVALYSEPRQEKAIFKAGPWKVDELINLVPKTLL